MTPARSSSQHHKSILQSSMNIAPPRPREQRWCNYKQKSTKRDTWLFSEALLCVQWERNEGNKLPCNRFCWSVPCLANYQILHVPHGKYKRGENVLLHQVCHRPTGQNALHQQHCNCNDRTHCNHWRWQSRLHFKQGQPANILPQTGEAHHDQQQ